MGDFNAHTGVNGGKIDTAGRMLMRRAGQIAGGLKVLNGTDICTGGHTRVGEDGTETTIDFVMVSSSLMPHVAGMSVLKDRMGSDHRLIVLKLRGLVHVARAETKPRGVWRMENILHYKSKEQYENMVGAFQEAFREWHASVKAHLASPAGADARPGDMCEVLEKSFQTQPDDVALEQIGRKLIGPASTPIMSAAVKRLNERRQECERQTRRAGLTDEERTKAVEAYRRAKGDLLAAVAARREELEL